jgi:DNA-binding CsgD family transcriptional regulator
LVESLLHRETVVLTPRETQLVTLVAQGLRNKEIAGTLGLTEGTVKVYLTRIFRKLDLDDRLELALYGLKNFFAGATGEDQSGGNARAEITCPRSLPRRQRDPATPILVH